MKLERILMWCYIYIILPIVKLFWKSSSDNGMNSIKSTRRMLVNTGGVRTALGDMIFLNTFIKVLIDCNKEMHVSFVVGHCDHRAEEFWQKHSWCNEVLIAPAATLRSLKSWVNFYCAIKRRCFDLSLIMISEPNRGIMTKWFPLDPLILSVICRVKQIIGDYNSLNEANFITSQFFFTTTGPHWLDEIRRWCRQLNINEDIIRTIKPAFRMKPEALKLPNHGHVFVTICHGGGSYWNRRWPLQKFEQLCSNIVRDFDATIVLLGGADEFPERAALEDFIVSLHPGARVINPHNPSLNEMANYIHISTVFIGNDSGPTHLASTLDTPIVAIFGPSDPKFFGVSHINALHLEVVNPLPCQPCQSQVYKTGVMGCHLSEDKYKCLNELEVDKVYLEVRKKITHISLP